MWGVEEEFAKIRSDYKVFTEDFIDEKSVREMLKLQLHIPGKLPLEITPLIQARKQKTKTEWSHK